MDRRHQVAVDWRYSEMGFDENRIDRVERIALEIGAALGEGPDRARSNIISLLYGDYILHREERERIKRINARLAERFRE